jgi:HEAT repeat protein
MNESLIIKESLLIKNEDGKSVKDLLTEMEQDEWDVRKHTVAELVKIGTPAVPALVAALKDENRLVKWGAIRALGEIKDPRAGAPLILVLKTEDRLEAKKALMKMGEAAAPHLIEALKAKESIIRKAALQVLANIINSDLVEPMLPLLEDADSGVRLEAVKALKIKDSRLLEPLISLLKDEKWSVRLNAAKALLKLEDPGAIEPLFLALKDENESIRRFAGEAVLTLSDLAVPPAPSCLINALTQPDEYTLATSVEALGNICDPRAVEPLIGILKKGNPNILHLAAHALGNIKSPQAVEPLINMLRDEDFNMRLDAARALLKIEDPRAIEPLTAALDDENIEAFIKHETENYDRYMNKMAKSMMWADGGWGESPVEIRKREISALKKDLNALIPHEPLRSAQPEIEQTTAIESNALQGIVEHELKKLELGRILFNPPKEMKVGVRERIEVRISKDMQENLLSGLKGRGVANIENVKIGNVMKVELFGDDFKIESLSEKEQFIASSEYSQWEWEVTPLESGNKVIYLSVSVMIHLEKLGEKIKSYPVLDRKIYVNVNFVYSLKKNWEWVVGTLIALIVAIITVLSFLKN